MKAGVCPHCGQRMQVRYGERFTIQQSDILGMIEDVTKGRGGISMESLIVCFFPNVPKHKAKARIKAVVWDINEKLLSTEYKVAGPGAGNKDGLYKFIKTARVP